MHKSVGAIIKNKKREVLMMDRKNFPFGWACPAGHIDNGETPEKALKREVEEETGLIVKDLKLLKHEFVEWNECSKGARGHDWYVYEVRNFEGEVKKEDTEAKTISWISKERIKELELEEIWKKWFKELRVLAL